MNTQDAYKYGVYVASVGCLPDSAYYASTLREAYAIAREEKEMWRDAGYKVVGNIRKHWRYDIVDSLYSIYIEQLDY